MVVDGKILLNAGPSPKSFHRIQQWFYCRQFYAYRYVMNQSFGPSVPLVRGGLIHVGMAHYYARLKALQEGQDPDGWHDPLTAVEIAAARNEFSKTAQDVKGLVKEVVDDYMSRPPFNPQKVVGVEQIVEFTIGPYSYTQRLDLITEENGKIYVTDHKHSSQGTKSSARYTEDMQFLATRHIGPYLWPGRFGGVKLNMIGVTRPFKYARMPISPAPNLVKCLPQQVLDAEEEIAKFASQGRDPMNYPKAACERVCTTSYGPCAARDICRWGDVSRAKPVTVEVSFFE